MNMAWYTQANGIITLKTYVQPGAKHNQITGLHNDVLKIRLTTPAIEGRANAALLKYIAELFDVSCTSIKLKRGDTSRYKTIEIHHSRVNPDDLLIDIDEMKA